MGWQTLSTSTVPQGTSGGNETLMCTHTQTQAIMK